MQKYRFAASFMFLCKVLQPAIPHHLLEIPLEGGSHPLLTQPAVARRRGGGLAGPRRKCTLESVSFHVFAFRNLRVKVPLRVHIAVVSYHVNAQYRVIALYPICQLLTLCIGEVVVRHIQMLQNLIFTEDSA
jgi:hypothetical protein